MPLPYLLLRWFCCIMFRRYPDAIRIFVVHYPLATQALKRDARSSPTQHMFVAHPPSAAHRFPLPLSISILHANSKPCAFCTAPAAQKRAQCHAHRCLAIWYTTSFGMHTLTVRTQLRHVVQRVFSPPIRYSPCTIYIRHEEHSSRSLPSPSTPPHSPDLPYLWRCAW